MMTRFLLALIILMTIFAERRCDTPSERAVTMLKKMNLEEKLRMMRGSLAGNYVGNIEGNERLGIPAIAMQDGPQGFRITKKTGEEGTSTAWPSSLNIAATFNSQLAFRWASAMAAEFVSKGANMQLAPGLGIARVPTAGRNFEYLCGEDPVLGSLLAYEVVKGIQSQGIIANAKHFINNEIETNRMEVSATVNEKVRFQLYYPPFQAAIDAGVLSVMCSYNRINGVSACENEVTMSELRNSLGYKGWVLSDWLATHSTVNSVRAGLDQELPIGLYLSESALKLALDFSLLQIEDIDRSVLRILTSMYTAGLFDEVDVRGDPHADVTSPEHTALAREVAAKSIVLLKNDKNLLPLNKSMLKKIGVFGDETTVSGGGSGHVTPSHGHTVTPAEGITAALVGYDAFVEYFELPKGVDKKKALELVSRFAATCDVTIVVVATTSTEGYDRPSLQLGHGQDELVAAVASANPHTVVAVNTPGAVLMPWAADVSTILVCWMPGEQAGNALADILFGTVNPSARLPVTMPNEDNEIGFTKEQFPGVGRPPVAEYSEGLLVGYRWYDAHDVSPLYPFGHGLSYTTFQYSNLQIFDNNRTDSSGHSTGQRLKSAECGVTLSESAKMLKINKLFSTVNDVGKMTSHTAEMPENPKSLQSRSTTESIRSLVSRFDDVISISATIQNTGIVGGTEIVQLYMGYPKSFSEPLRQLKGIQVADLGPGESTNVTFVLTSQDLAVWDPNSHVWSIPCVRTADHNCDCRYDFFVGASSRDLRLNGTVIMM